MTDNLHNEIIEAIQQRKGRQIALVDLSSAEPTLTDEFIICQGTSVTNVEAIADNVREYVQEATGQKPYSYDGYGPSEWIIIDYGHIMVHVMQTAARERYDLEGLWADVPVTHVPDLD